MTELPANTDLLLQVSDPGGNTIGSKQFRAVADPLAPGSFHYEVNHIGAEENDCFDGATSPDIRPGDTLTVSSSAGGELQRYTPADVRYESRFDAATAATATTPAVPATMTVSGWAKSADGTQPIAAPELRLQRGPFVADVEVTGGSLDRFRDNRLLIGPDQDATGAFLTTVSPITEDTVSEAILEVIEAGDNATSFSGDASFALPGCPALDTTRGSVVVPELPPAPRAVTPTPVAPLIVDRPVDRVVERIASQQVAAPATVARGARIAGLRSVSALRLKSAKRSGIAVSFTSRGIATAELRLYSLKGGRKLVAAKRAGLRDGSHTIRLASRTMRKRLASGRYLLQVSAGGKVVSKSIRIV